MTAEERQHRIEEYVQNVEFASLDELVRHVGVSMSTVRRDLNILASQGSILRTHGGARLVAPRSDEFAFSARDTHEAAEKEIIGNACADLIRQGQTVIFDAGTTVYHVATKLLERNLQIVTNSMPVANLFSSDQKTEVVVTGGVVYPRLGVLVGPMAVKGFSEIHADVAIMGAGGITVDGITNSHALLIDIQRAIIKSAGRVVFCLDHIKFGRKSVAFLCSLRAGMTVVTDNLAPKDAVEALRSGGIQVIVVSPDGTIEGKWTADRQLQSPAIPPTEEPADTTESPLDTPATVSLVGWD